MFSITCRTCAARLKVKSDAAIGQRLACPKCGEMVEVTPPPGWVAPQESAQNSVDGSDFDDIDQIIGGSVKGDHVKRDPSQPRQVGDPGRAEAAGRNTSGASGNTQGSSAPAKSPQPPAGTSHPIAAGKPSKAGSVPHTAPQPSGKNSPSTAPVDRAPRDSSETFPALQTSPINSLDKPLLKPRSDQFELGQPREYLPDPNLPPPDWSKKGKSNSRTLMVSGLLLAGLLGVIAAIIALLNQSGSQTNDQQIAQAEQPNEQRPAESSQKKSLGDAGPNGEQAKLKPEAPADPVTPTAKDGSLPEQEPSTAPPKNPSDGAGNAPSKATGDAEAEGATEKQVNDSNQASAEPPSETQPLKPDLPATLPGRDERPVSPLVGEKQPDENLPGGVPSQTTPTPSAESPGATSLTDRLGKLSQLLAGPGTSLTELGDLAQSERTDRLVGLPRYLITQPTPTPAPNDPWSLPIAEIEYRDTPLHLLISELSALSGAPICLDALALARSGIAVDAPVSVQLTDTTLGEVLTTVLKQLRLERSTIEGVEVILPEGANQTGAVRFPLPKLKEAAPEKYQRLADNLPKLIDPVSWTIDSANRKAVVEGTELLVSNTSTAAALVGEFLSKLAAAQQVREVRGDAAAIATLRSRSTKAEEGLRKPLQLQTTLDQTLEQFLQRVYQESGIAITVDWSSLAAAGWSQQSVVPGDFQAATIEQLLRELARSLNATWLEIDERTFQLTSFQEAARRQLVEVHSLEGLAIEPAPLLEILTQTLGAQLRDNPLIRFVYEPEANALIVVAPQSVQRQFEAIVNRLKQPAPQ